MEETVEEHVQTVTQNHGVKFKSTYKSDIFASIASRVSLTQRLFLAQAAQRRLAAGFFTSPFNELSIT